MYIPCSSSSKIGVKRKIGTSLGVLLCCHQHLVFLQEAKSPTQNFFWMGLGFFKVVFVPYIPDCPSRHYPPFQLHQRQLFHQHLKKEEVSSTICAFLESTFAKCPHVPCKSTFPQQMAY